MKAHVGVCVIAYAMLSLLDLLLHRGGLSVSGEQALHSLSAITREEVPVGPLTFWVRSELTAEHERILSTLGLPTPPKGGSSAGDDDNDKEKEGSGCKMNGSRDLGYGSPLGVKVASGPFPDPFVRSARQRCRSAACLSPGSRCILFLRHF